MNTKSKILAEVAAHGREVRPGAASEVALREGLLVLSLTEIRDRIEDLLTLFEASPLAAVGNITRSAGASGPIGSLWEKALADAVVISTLTTYALVPTEEA